MFRSFSKIPSSSYLKEEEDVGGTVYHILYAENWRTPLTSEDERRVTIVRIQDSIGEFALR